jgi:hypothetical protein
VEADDLSHLLDTDLMGLMLNDGEFGCGPEAVTTQLAGAAGELSPATAVGRKRALDIKFSSGLKRSRPASERATTAISCERALDVQDDARSLEPDSTVSDHLPAPGRHERRRACRRVRQRAKRRLARRLALARRKPGPASRRILEPQLTQPMPMTRSPSSTCRRT